MTTAAPIMLTGQSLVDYVDEKMVLVNRNELSRTDMIIDAGYVYDNGKAMYTQFYTELLNAKGISPVTNRDVADKEYEDLPVEKRNLYDAIDERLGTKWTHEELIEFIENLEDIGIETVSDFEDAFTYESDEYHAEADFAEYLANEYEYNLKDSIVYAAIDWQAVWDHSLRYDYAYFDTANGTYFFRNN